MIFLDADILIIDRCYPNDPKEPDNKRFLNELETRSLDRGMVLQGLLEVVGKLSYNSSVNQIHHLQIILAKKYGLVYVPSIALNPEYTTHRFDDIMSMIARKMSLGDAVMALQIQDVAISGDLWCTWNAKHFAGKVSIPVLTPAEWLAANPAPKS